MVVRIRFGQGPLVTRRRGKNGRLAQLLASLLTLFAISFFLLAVWRLGGDLGFAGDFAFTSGLASHWQIWMAATAVTQYAAILLSRYYRNNREAQDGETPGGLAENEAPANA